MIETKGKMYCVRCREVTDHAILSNGKVVVHTCLTCKKSTVNPVIEQKAVAAGA